jgi:hypothetical protein
MSYVDQKPRVVTEQDVEAKWGGYPVGSRFRCYLCGHKFKVGDIWRWVYAGKHGQRNFMVCESCDHENVIDDWIKANEELKQKYWWFVQDYESVMKDL